MTEQSREDLVTYALSDDEHMNLLKDVVDSQYDGLLTKLPASTLLEAKINGVNWFIRIQRYALIDWTIMEILNKDDILANVNHQSKNYWQVLLCRALLVLVTYYMRSPYRWRHHGNYYCRRHRIAHPVLPYFPRVGWCCQSN